MKNKLKDFWKEYNYFFLLAFALMLVFMIPFIGSLRAEKDNPMDSTSEKGIEAKSLEYKGHQYILFEKSNVFGSISVLHDPDCSNCKKK